MSDIQGELYQWKRTGSLRRGPCGAGPWVPCAVWLRWWVVVAGSLGLSSVVAAQEPAFLATYCADCHDEANREGGLDLAEMSREMSLPAVFNRWVRLHDRVAAGDMPPRDAPQPPASERAGFVKSLAAALTAAERTGPGGEPHLRRLTRSEYENTVRDLFELPGIALANRLPADGSAHGFDKHAEALDISHVHVRKYLEAADHILDEAIATRPQPPAIQRRRISLANRGGFVAHVLMNGDGVLLKNGQPDPEFPPAGDQNHLDQGAHERWGSFRNGASVGLFRHEDESFNPYFIEHVTIYPGRYRVRTPLWSFRWDRGKVLPGRGTEAARLSVVQLTGDGRGGQHPSYVLGYFDAPPDGPREHELTVWLNRNEILGFNTASLAPVANYARQGRALAFTGPGIVVDWLEIEGPLYPSWPPPAHRVLFGELPLREFQPAADGPRPPRRLKVRQLGAGQNRPDPEPGVWTVHSEHWERDAERLLGRFLPRLFRRPVAAAVRREYLEVVRTRIAAGDGFEQAMRAAFRTALVAPDFLYHVEPPEGPDNHALACRLSYLLWNSAPDERLIELAASEQLLQGEVLHAEVERLLADPRSQRFVHDFLDQWLRLREIAATDPDRKLYPEFSAYLQDSMLAESRAYFRELLDRDLDATYLVRSPFAMVNQKLAEHYGLVGVEGTRIRPVPLPDDCPRGGVLTQAAILKVTANGTTTSPVPRGAFVLDRLLGQPPQPPPANVAAIEPDVQGATTIRDQLTRHREHAACATCHRHIDPPGFALEAFDVIGGFRTRYRSLGQGEAAPRGAIDPFIPIQFRLGPPVDPSGQLSDGRRFDGIREYQQLLASEASRQLLDNLARQLAVYATGRSLRFSDRPALEELVRRTLARGGGIRTLLHQLVASPLFTGDSTWREADEPGQTRRVERTGSPRVGSTESRPGSAAAPPRLMMALPIDQVTEPVRAPASPALAGDPPVSPADDGDKTIAVAVRGLFVRERLEALRRVFDEIPEARLLRVDYATALATVGYAKDSPAFRGAGGPDQMIERLNQRVRQLSGYTLSVEAPSEVDAGDWQRVAIPIVGLDCQACGLAVYDTLRKQPGVERATASFRQGLAEAWVRPGVTDVAKLREALQQRGITLGPAGSE